MIKNTVLILINLNIIFGYSLLHKACLTKTFRDQTNKCNSLQFQDSFRRNFQAVRTVLNSPQHCTE